METPARPRTTLTPRTVAAVSAAKASGLLRQITSAVPSYSGPKRNPTPTAPQQRQAQKIIDLCDPCRDETRRKQFIHTVGCMDEPTFRLLYCLVLYHEMQNKKLALACPVLCKVATYLQRPDCHQEHFRAATEKLKKSRRNLSNSGVASIFWNDLRNPETRLRPTRPRLEETDERWIKGANMRPRSHPAFPKQHRKGR